MPTPLLVCGRSHDEVKAALCDALTLVNSAMDNYRCSDIACVTRFLAVEELLKRRILAKLVRCPCACTDCSGGV